VVLGVFSMEIKNRMRLNWLQQLKLWNYHDIGRTLLGGILSFKQTLQMWFNGWLNPLSGRAWRFNDLFILAGRFSSCLGPVSFTRAYVHQGRLITVQMFLLYKESVEQKIDDSWMGDVAFLLQHDATSEQIILYDCCFLIVAVDRR
jgi:hypothetical protein